MLSSVKVFVQIFEVHVRSIVVKVYGSGQASFRVVRSIQGDEVGGSSTAVCARKL